MKPTVKLSGTDGNVFSIIGKVSRVLKGGIKKEFENKALSAESYDDVLQLCFKYVEVE